MMQNLEVINMVSQARAVSSVSLVQSSFLLLEFSL